MAEVADLLTGPDQAVILPDLAAGCSMADMAEGESVERAWQELDVPQCGYCQAGQLMSAAALLARTSRPTDAQIDSAMNGNICRCGTYLRIREAIHLAANGGRR